MRIHFSILSLACVLTACSSEPLSQSEVSELLSSQSLNPTCTNISGQFPTKIRETTSNSGTTTQISIGPTAWMEFPINVQAARDSGALEFGDPVTSTRFIGGEAKTFRDFPVKLAEDVVKYVRPAERFQSTVCLDVMVVGDPRYTLNADENRATIAYDWLADDSESSQKAAFLVSSFGGEIVITGSDSLEVIKTNEGWMREEAFLPK